ncbi:MAG TPA: SDR family oxidoreductase [Spirochaetales bacterium]|nr:SDR family oxidoreductase [Spirochaetales bacterium]
MKDARNKQGPGTALVTGASGGIGAEFARALSREGWRLVLAGRNAERLESVRAGLQGPRAKEAIALQADLSEPGAGERLHRACREGGLEVDLLVNNAGSGLLGQSADLPPAALEAMAALNVTALTVLSSLFGRDMRDRGSGRILNVGSFAGLNATPYFAAYAATKSYVLSFSLALRAELKPRGVGVTCLLPGYVRTNFDAAAGIRSAKYLAFSERNAMDAADVARIGLRALARGRAWTVAGARNRLAATVLGLLPRAAAPALMKASLDGLLAKEGR